jgi:hypothetical protein
MDRTTERPTQDRREGRPPKPGAWGELLVESSWRPTDRPRVESTGWLIAHGYAPERRDAR